MSWDEPIKDGQDAIDELLPQIEFALKEIKRLEQEMDNMQHFHVKEILSLKLIQDTLQSNYEVLAEKYNHLLTLHHDKT